MHRTTRTLLWTLCASSSHGFQRQQPSSGPLIAARHRSIDPTTKLPSLPSLTRSVNTSRRHVAATEADDEEATNKNDLLSSSAITPPPATKDGQSRARRLQIALQTEIEEKQDQFFLLLAVLPSVVAFLSWEDVSLALANFLNDYGAVGQDVDGNLFANNLLRPTITGVVVPVIAIALATLVNTTINVLRDREVELRTLINMESCDLRLLRRAVFGLFGTRQHATRRARALDLMRSYVEQLERECSAGAVEALEELQVSGGIATNELDEMTDMLHGVDGAAASRQGSIGYADDLIRSLNDNRSRRVAELLSGFPAIHWGVLIVLSFAVCALFLLESNQPIHQYLNSVSLRALFALLVGVCSGTATICLNLADPFRGTFSILEASTQLGDLRLCLEEDVAEATCEAGEISSSLVRSILRGGSKDSGGSIIDGGGIAELSGRHTRDTEPDAGQNDDWDEGGDLIMNSKAKKEPRRYGLVPTLYFHLLTGPFGSNVRALGDVIAWLSTFAASRTRILSQRVVALSAAFGRRKGRRWRRNGGASKNQ